MFTTTLLVIKVNVTSNGTNWDQHHVLPDVIYWERHNIISMVFLTKMHILNVIIKWHQINPTSTFYQIFCLYLSKLSISRKKKKARSECHPKVSFTIKNINDNWKNMNKVCRVENIVLILIYWFRSLISWFRS